MNNAGGGDWPGASEEFPSTRWSLLRRMNGSGSSEGDDALEWLCRSYWRPIYAYIRRRGHSIDQACDLTQDFFASILARRGFGRLEPGLGRFRAYLLACCKHFLANSRERDAALKRGGGQRPWSIDARDAEERYLAEPVDALTPEACFERQWALSLLDLVAAEIRGEYERKGKLVLFDQLQSCLFQEAEARSHAEIAESLGMGLDAVKKSAQRLRERYRDLLRAHVARAVDDPSLIQDETRELLSALAGGRSRSSTVG